VTHTLLLRLLSFDDRFEFLVDIRQIVLVQPKLGDAALVIDRHRRLVSHGALDVVDADVIAEDPARIGVRLLDRCASKADERTPRCASRVREAGARMEGRQVPTRIFVGYEAR
jgi:hypothetical protein